mmetsp:Transcript_15120/g.33346  ORF Transcript_15120/g.33346 Transcript_15120/m.33346 type:complete len:153 (+) Transcript_15120:140-598(+)
MVARLVVTHSTYLPGLIKVLKKVALSDIISTIVPGRIYHTNSNLQSQLELRLTTFTTINSNGITSSSSSSSSSSNSAGAESAAEAELQGYEGSTTQKIIARKSSQTQEVFLVFPTGSFSEVTIEDHLAMLLRKERVTIGTHQLRTAAHSEGN